MAVFKSLEKRQQELIREAIIKHGLILFGFNVALILSLFFALVGLGTFLTLISVTILEVIFTPLLAIFLFAGACSIVWFRYGQALRQSFKDKAVVYGALAVLISVLPLLLLLLFFSFFFNVIGGLSVNLTYAFLGTLFVTMVAVIFELAIVSLGAVMA